MTDASIINEIFLFVQYWRYLVKHFSISLRSFADVQAFVSLAMVQPFQVLVGSENQRINGKNFMGMFSLDYSHPLQVSVDCDETEFVKFRKAAAQFLVA